MDEFAAELGIRKRRVVIWLTKPTNHLDPSEAVAASKIPRNQQAEQFLDDPGPSDDSPSSIATIARPFSRHCFHA